MVQFIGSEGGKKRFESSDFRTTDRKTSGGEAKMSCGTQSQLGNPLTRSCRAVSEGRGRCHIQLWILAIVLRGLQIWITFKNSSMSLIALMLQHYSSSPLKSLMCLFWPFFTFVLFLFNCLLHQQIGEDMFPSFLRKCASSSGACPCWLLQSYFTLRSPSLPSLIDVFLVVPVTPFSLTLCVPHCYTFPCRSFSLFTSPFLTCYVGVRYFAMVGS